jgi:hypothetical protein
MVSASASAAQPASHWVASWGAAQQIPEPANELAAEHWRDASIRQVLHLTVGGKQFRVRISNAYGTAPLMLEAASVALAGSDKITPHLRRPQRRHDPGRRRILQRRCRHGAETGRRPGRIAVFQDAPARQTGHPGARATTLLTKGNRVNDATWDGATKVTRWYALSDVEVQAPRNVGALVAIGDSITDGYGVPADTNTRWTDVLAARLRDNKMTLGVVNAGIGGGRMLRDGLGPNLVRASTAMCWAAPASPMHWC